MRSAAFSVEVGETGTFTAAVTRLRGNSNKRLPKQFSKKSDHRVQMLCAL